VLTVTKAMNLTSHQVVQGPKYRVYLEEEGQSGLSTVRLFRKFWDLQGRRGRSHTAKIWIVEHEELGLSKVKASATTWGWLRAKLATAGQISEYPLRFLTGSVGNLRRF
jgi:hypothetical protein